MSHADFIYRNVKQALEKDGISSSLANSSALKAVEHFNRSSKASKAGAMFHDCLNEAKKHAKLCKVMDNQLPVIKKRTSTNQLDLFDSKGRA